MNWHERYSQQAGWTRDLRKYLFEKADLKDARCVLEVGCGTGAILSDLQTPASIHGLDLAPKILAEARVHVPGAILVRGDALSLPYPNFTFDITFCHFLLLWVRDPFQAIREMARVTRPGGHVLALAEPDYSQRVDQPKSLEQLGKWQTDSLRAQGANPSFGAHLTKTFVRAGIEILETGTIKRLEKDAAHEEREKEWAVLEADLAGLVTDQDIQSMKTRDADAWARGERVLFVPTYFAWGRV